MSISIVENGTRQEKRSARRREMAEGGRGLRVYIGVVGFVVGEGLSFLDCSVFKNDLVLLDMYI